MVLLAVLPDPIANSERDFGRHAVDIETGWPSALP